MNPPGLFVSQVGRQPAAIAVTLAPLVDAGLLSRIVLLPTSHTLAYAEKLRQWQERRHPDLTTILLPFNAEHDAEQLAAVLKRHAADHPDAPLYFNLAGGFSFFWAKVSRLMQGVDNLHPVFSEVDRVFDLAGGHSRPLTNFGLAELFELHGVKARWEATERAEVVKKLKVFDEDGKTMATAFDFAYEKHGGLYALRQNINDLTQAREVLDLLRKAPALKGLQPRILATSAQEAQFRRLRQAGCDVLPLFRMKAEKTQARLERWFSGNPTPPGRVLPLSADAEQRPTVAPLPGAGGDGPPLLVCLGNDPSVTLSAIYSQRPCRAWVLYDKTTPRIVHHALNMARLARDFPVDRITFFPVGAGYLAEGISAGTLPFVLTEPELLANITPGSKAQSWAFGQLPGVTLTSINTRCKPPAVENLLGEVTFSRTVDPGPAMIVGQVIGGEGVQPRLTEQYLRENSALLREVSRCVAMGSDKGGNFHFFDPKSTLTRKIGPIRLESHWENDRIHVGLRENGKVVEGSFSAPMEKGKVKADWLEDVAGWAFLEAGGKDLCVGMTWPWGSVLKQNGHRTEIDVVFTWRHVHVVVSVKALPLTGQKRERKCAEVRAMAKECFGRFALPVLVYYTPLDFDMEKTSLNFLKQSEVLPVPARFLAQSSRLAGLLDAALDTLQTR